MKATFFGHGDTPTNVEPLLTNCLIDLIENHNADTFYVGNQGSFDGIVKRILYKLKRTYTYIKIHIVLAYMPKANEEFISDSIYPEGLESVPPKFAISKRNQIMINLADCVVVYVKYPFGGAAKFKDFAEKRNKWIINLAEMNGDALIK